MVVIKLYSSSDKLSDNDLVVPEEELPEEILPEEILPETKNND